MAQFFQRFNKKLSRKSVKAASPRVDDPSALDDTAELRAVQPSSRNETMTDTPVLQPPQLIVGSGHSVGKQRDHNEDALFTLSTTIVRDDEDLVFGLFIVADGMGGHHSGEKASGIALQAMAGKIVANIYAPLLDPAKNKSEISAHQILREGVQEGHRSIVQQTPGGGTTLTAAIVLGETITVAHVGDSRAYALHSNGDLDILTRDHTLVKRLQELGQITADEAVHHPQRNVLYRALGQGEPFDAEVASYKIFSGYLLLCSDGLWGVIGDDKIQAITAAANSPQDACQQLVAAANEAGGPDNISAILIRLPA